MNKTQEQFFISKINREMSKFEEEQLSFLKQSIYNNAKEIFIRNMIFIYLSANAEAYKLSKFPKNDILEILQNKMLNCEYELNECGVGEMLEEFEEDEVSL